MPRSNALAVRIVAIALVPILLAACSSGATTPNRVVTVTVPASSGTRPASPSSASSAMTSATPSASSSSGQTQLGGTCASLLPDALVTQALGVPTLAGQDAFVVGLPDPAIGRRSTINCRYGVTGTGASATPKVEIGVSLYTTPAQAGTRIAATTQDYMAHGASSVPTTVAGMSATVLSGATGAGYDVPLLVLSAGQRTVAIGIAVGVTTKATAAQDLAVLVLQRTTG